MHLSMNSISGATLLFNDPLFRKPSFAIGLPVVSQLVVFQDVLVCDRDIRSERWIGHYDVNRAKPNFIFGFQDIRKVSFREILVNSCDKCGRDRLRP